MQPETMMIDNVKYIREDSISAVVYNGEETLMSRYIGKKVIVRTRNEGINAGVIVYADETGIELKDCRRIWYHEPLDKSVSWYEGVAMTGISKNSKVSCTIPTKIIVEDYSITICKDEAFKTIMELKPNEQS